MTRARKHIHGRRPRFAVDRQRQMAVLQEFLAACATGDLSQLTALLTEDAVCYSDGGGKVSAALNPISGPGRIARFLIGIGKKIPGITVQFAEVNGEAGVILIDAGKALGVMAVDVTPAGRVGGLYVVMNPDKLRTG